MDAESISQTCMRLIAQSFFFLAVTRVIPEIAGTLVSGASTTGAHTMYAIRGGGMAAAGAVTGAIGGAYNLPGAVANGYVKNSNAVESAVNAYSSKFDESRSRGNNPLIAGVSALGGALWSSYRAGDNSGDSNRSDSQKPDWQNAAASTTTTEPRPTQPASPLNPIQPPDPASGINGFSKPSDQS
jgi:type IV secretory pathway TrbL component